MYSRNSTFILLCMLFVRLATLNTRGLNERKKQLAIVELLKEKKVNIAILQETNLSLKKEKSFEKIWEGTTCIFNAGPNKSGNGVAVISLDPNIHISHASSDCKGKIVSVGVEIHKEKFRLINVHFPNRDGGQCTDQKKFIDNFDIHLQSKDPIIIGGDFNFVENPSFDRYPTPKRNADPAGETWQKFCKIYDLKDSYIMKRHKGKFFTWKQKKASARLDRFYVDKNINIRNIEKYECASSDHDLVINELDISHGKRRGKGVWKCNNKVFEMNDFKTELRFLISKEQELPEYKTDPVNWWIKVKNKIKTLCIKYSNILKQNENEEKLKLENEVNRYKNVLGNENYEKKYFDAKRKLNDFILKNMKEKLIKQRYRNFGKNYFTTKEFFRQFRKARRDRQIEKLKDKEGLIKTDTSDLLEIAKDFYVNLYKKRNVDKEAQKMFLEKIEKKITNADINFLNRVITSLELEQALKKTKENRSPGIDGISANFYKYCFEIIGVPLTNVLNTCFCTGLVPYDMKISILTLLYKKGDPELMQNYRPLSLQNNDLKLLTKILCIRLKSLMGSLISEHQYANASKNISTAITLIRDLYSCSKKRSNEHFFISIDFVKAYDSIDREYLFDVLEKIGFRGNFLAIIKNVYTGSTAKIVLNGFVSKTVKMRRGIRQGDALSLYLFIIAIDPLLLALERHPGVEGVKSPGRFHTKSVSYADDVNLCLKGRKSVQIAYEIITNFGKSTGLNPQPLGTSKASTCLLVNTRYAGNLPNFRFTTLGYETLGSAVGTDKFILDFWEEEYKNAIEPEIDFLINFNLSLDAKSVLSKSKILPKISYNSAFYEIPEPIKRKIETKMAKFSLGNHGGLRMFEEITRDKQHGGYDICHVTKHSELSLLKPIFRLLKCKREGIPLTVDTALTEAEVGLKMTEINSKLNLQPLRNIPHHASISKHYKAALDIIRYYKISAEELATGKIDVIYKIIQNGSSRTKYPGVPNVEFIQMPECRTTIHHDILPNYLKTFIYRMKNCLIPLKCTYTDFGLDNDSRCEFCNINYETNYHVFMECEKVKTVWEVIEVKTGLSLLNNNIINFRHSETIDHYNITVYVTALVCHKIWKIRNQIKHGETECFNIEFIVNSFVKSFHSRKLFEDRRTPSIYRQDFTDILQRFV